MPKPLAVLKSGTGSYQLGVPVWAHGMALAIALSALGGAAEARNLTVCVSQNPLPPLTYPDREGSAQTLVRRAVEQQGDSVSFVAAPWVR